MYLVECFQSTLVSIRSEGLGDPMGGGGSTWKELGESSASCAFYCAH